MTNHCRSIAERVEYVPDGLPVPNDCEQNLAKKREGVTTPCSHCFHRCCLGKWLTINNSCPMCKTAFTQEFKTKVQGPGQNPGQNPGQGFIEYFLQEEFPTIRYRYLTNNASNQVLSYATGIEDASVEIVTVPRIYFDFIPTNIDREFFDLVDANVSLNQNIYNTNFVIVKRDQYLQWAKGYTTTEHIRMFNWRYSFLIVFFNVIFTHVEQDGSPLRASDYFQPNESYKEAFTRAATAWKGFYSHILPSLVESLNEIYTTAQVDVSMLAEIPTNLNEKIETTQYDMNNYEEQLQELIENPMIGHGTFQQVRTLQLQMFRHIIDLLPDQDKQEFISMIRGICQCAYKSKTLTFHLLRATFSYFVDDSRRILVFVSQILYNWGQYFATGGQL